jgi:hypothetical protein
LIQKFLFIFIALGIARGGTAASAGPPGWNNEL